MLTRDTLPAGSAGTQPPDLLSDVPPGESTGGARSDEDVLAGWDEEVAGPERGSMQAPFRLQRLGAQLPILAALAAIVGGGLTGGFLGALLGGRRRSLGAAIGTLAGAGTAAAGVARAGEHLLDKHPEGV